MTMQRLLMMITIPIIIFFGIVISVLLFALVDVIRQKTRSPQQRRMYVGSHPRHSLGQQEPSVYVSPSNLPPPPKYEFMAPPSYDEAVGVHYPQFNAQPISQPITAALAQASSAPPAFDSVTSTVVNETRRTSVART